MYIFVLVYLRTIKSNNSDVNYNWNARKVLVWNQRKVGQHYFRKMAPWMLFFSICKKNSASFCCCAFAESVLKLIKNACVSMHFIFHCHLYDLAHSNWWISQRNNMPKYIKWAKLYLYPKCNFFYQLNNFIGQNIWNNL